MRLTQHAISRVFVLCAVAVSTFASGCERVVDLDLRDGPRRLVVEASLERVHGNVSGRQSIKLSTTSPYFSPATAPPARNAVVRVVSDKGDTVTFAESSIAGTYSTNALTVQHGSRYTLHVEFEGQKFMATESTQTVPTIDSLYFDTQKWSPFPGPKSGVRATIDFVDPANVRNYYLWDLFVDGVRQLGPDTVSKMRVGVPDDVLNGLSVKGFQPFEGINIPVGAEVRVRQIGISEAIYRYHYALSDQAGPDGSPFSVPPSSVRGNVANLTNPSSPARGYFSVSEVSEVTGTYRK